jgi:hypothetical protein
MNKPNLVGKRIELVFTDDLYTKLKPGDKGTVTSVDDTPFPDTPFQVSVKWDSGSNLMMIPPKDIFKVLD